MQKRNLADHFDEVLIQVPKKDFRQRKISGRRWLIGLRGA